MAIDPTMPITPALPPKQNPENQLRNKSDHKKANEAQPAVRKDYGQHVAQGGEHKKKQDVPTKKSSHLMFLSYLVIHIQRPYWVASRP